MAPAGFTPRPSKASWVLLVAHAYPSNKQKRDFGDVQIDVCPGCLAALKMGELEWSGLQRALLNDEWACEIRVLVWAARLAALWLGGACRHGRGPRSAVHGHLLHSAWGFVSAVVTAAQLQGGGLPGSQGGGSLCFTATPCGVTPTSWQCGHVPPVGTATGLSLKLGRWRALPGRPAPTDVCVGLPTPLCRPGIATSPPVCQIRGPCWLIAVRGVGGGAQITPQPPRGSLSPCGQELSSGLLSLRTVPAVAVGTGHR